MPLCFIAIIVIIFITIMFICLQKTIRRQPLLPGHRTNSFTLRDRRHNLQFTCRLSAITDCNYTTAIQRCLLILQSYLSPCTLCYISNIVYMSFVCSLVSRRIFIRVVFCLLWYDTWSCGLSCFLLNEYVRLVSYEKSNDNEI